jgi:hypothetical protein
VVRVVIVADEMEMLEMRLKVYGEMMVNIMYIRELMMLILGHRDGLTSSEADHSAKPPQPLKRQSRALTPIQHLSSSSVANHSITSKKCFIPANSLFCTPLTAQLTTMSTFHLFPQLPKEMRLKIYENTFEPRMLQLGVDAGVPFPPEMEPLGASKGPTNKLHTRLPSLFAVCQESRDLCKFFFVAFGPTFIHPKLDTLYISLYAVGRMITTDLKLNGACNDDGSSAYPVAAFDKVAIEYGLIKKDLPDDLEVWKAKPKKWQVRHGIKEYCAPGMWPATDYAEFFRCFGAPREVLCVTNGVLNWAGGFSRFSSWRGIELVATEMGSGDQENVVEFLKAQLPSSLTGGGMEFKVVDAQKEHTVLMAPAPYSWLKLRDLSERYMWV